LRVKYMAVALTSFDEKSPCMSRLKRGTFTALLVLYSIL
jgi:hypothetical protein